MAGILKQGLWSGRVKNAITLMLLLLIVATGAYFRFSGLMRDWPQSFSYHPDVPKQIRAGMWYRDGVYYNPVGEPVYDGYPLFNNLMNAKVLEGMETVCRAFTEWFWSEEVDIPWQSDITDVFAATLVQNALLSSLAPLLLFFMGWQVSGRRTALIASFLLAICPLDIAVAHFGTGDVASAFFLLCTLVFCVGVAKNGSLWMYAGAAVSIALGFAAKYHAVIVGISLLASHFLYHGWRGGWSWRVLIRVIPVFFFCMVMTVLIAIPSLRMHPEEMIQSIRGFLSLNAAFAVPTEVERMGVIGKAFYAWRQTLPDVVRVLGLAFTLSFIAGSLLTIRKDHRLLRVFVVLAPIYLAAVMGLRPAHHVIYLSLISAGGCLLAASAVSSRPLPICHGRKWAGYLWRCGQIVLLVTMIWRFGEVALHENAAYQLCDTRHAAAVWGQRYLSGFFAIDGDTYTGLSDWPEPVREDGRPPSVVLARSSLTGAGPSSNDVVLTDFSIERDTLPVFRNPVIWIMHGDRAEEDWRADWFMPVWQRTQELAADPYDRRSDRFSGQRAAFLDSAELWSTVRHINFDEGETCRDATLVTTQDISNVTMVIYNGCLTSDVTVETRTLFLGWKEVASLQLPPGGRTVVTVPVRTSHIDGFNRANWFPLRVHHAGGPMEIVVAEDVQESALALFYVGRYNDAAPLLQQMEQDEWEHAITNPLMYLYAVVASDLAECPMPPERMAAWQSRVDDLDALLAGNLSFIDYCGLSESLINSWSNIDEPSAQTLSEADFRWDGFLEPGAYDVSVELSSFYERNASGMVTWMVRDVEGREVASGVTDSTAVFSTRQHAGRIEPKRALFSFVWGPTSGFASISLLIPTPNGVRTAKWSIRPNLRETLRCWNETAKFILDGREAGIGAHNSIAADVLRAHALRLKETDSGRAQSLAEKALSLSPNRLDLHTLHREATVSSPVFVDVNRSFENNVALRGIGLERSQCKAGERIGLNFYWDIPQYVRGRGRAWSTFVHVVDDQGEIVAQGDRPLIADWKNVWPVNNAFPPFNDKVVIPASVAPGEYRIFCGLWDPSTGERIVPTDVDESGAEDEILLPITIAIESD